MRKYGLAVLVLFSTVAVGCGELPTSPSRVATPGAAAHAVAPQPDLIGEQDD